MDDRIQKLAEKARGLPKAPGVYLMKDDKGRVIYVGKSASLRDRVASYFQASTRFEHKKSGLLDHVVDFEVLQTESEVEALLAENRLIQFLEGDKKSVIALLDKDMIQASKDLNFERAARLRDEIKALQALGARAGRGEEEYWQPEAFVHNPREGMIELQQALGLAE